MVESHAILQVADGVLDLGMAAVVGLQVQSVSLPVGDEGVMAVVGEQGQLGAGRGFHPPDYEPHWFGIGLGSKGRVGDFGHVGRLSQSL